MPTRRPALETEALQLEERAGHRGAAPECRGASAGYQGAPAEGDARLRCAAMATRKRWCSRSSPTRWTFCAGISRRRMTRRLSASRARWRSAGHRWHAGGSCRATRSSGASAKGSADILLCTDAAAEGLNFQFCGALVNYDMPWNPMRVEQRIGRIDRVGQQHPSSASSICTTPIRWRRTCTLHLRKRIGLFESVVGRRSRSSPNCRVRSRNRCCVPRSTNNGRACVRASLRR